MRAPGDADLEALWHDWHRHVLAYALRRADPVTAEEAVADADVPGRPLPWLLGVARRVLANQRRGERRRHALVDRLRARRPGPEAPDGESEGRALVALAALGERDREVVLLHAWEGLDHAEAGTAMGCSASTFTVRLYRARRRFERELARVDAGAEVER